MSDSRLTPISVQGWDADDLRSISTQGWFGTVVVAGESGGGGEWPAFHQLTATVITGTVKVASLRLKLVGLVEVSARRKPHKSGVKRKLPAVPLGASGTIATVSASRLDLGSLRRRDEVLLLHDFDVVSAELDEGW